MTRMPQLLIVQHTPSPSVQAMLEAVLRGARDPGAGDADVLVRAALASGPADLLAADAVVLGTPANIGYMSGALKHWFDTVYYPSLEVTAGLPYGLFVHGNDDTAGAIRSVQRIADGLRWRAVAQPVSVVGTPDGHALESCHDLGALLAHTACNRTR